MAIESKLESRLEKLKKEMEDVSGQPIDASLEQLFPLSFRVSLSSSEDGVIMSRHIIFPGKSCAQASGLAASLFDMTSRSSTGSDGTRTFLLSDFMCSTINSFGEPVNVLVTPNTTQPCYATMTHSLVPNPSAPGSFNDLQINVLTWKPDGSPAPDVSFDWRCRLLMFQIIF